MVRVTRCATISALLPFRNLSNLATSGKGEGTSRETGAVRGEMPEQRFATHSTAPHREEGFRLTAQKGPSPADSRITFCALSHEVEEANSNSDIAREP
jgi:hypothetical protein